MQQLSVDSETTAADLSLTGLAAWWTILLLAFFFASYIFAAWITHLRHNVPSLVFGWEVHIPFLAWTIVPYWSTDLLYVCSPFLFNSRAELATHCKRLLAVQVLSVVIFLLFPLRLTFDRPPTTGLLGWMFLLRTGVDTQFNDAPSLHIGFAVVLWQAYSRHLKGKARWLMRSWIVLMSLATLTTFQHHFIDLPTGLWAGLFCTAMFPDGCAPLAGTPLPDSSKWFRIGALYAVGAILFSAAAYRVGNVAWLILWPASALAFVVYRRWQSTNLKQSNFAGGSE
jgi:hypothetical protein